MKKAVILALFAALFTYCVGICNTGIKVSAAENDKKPDITSQTAIVADADTGYIYYDKGMHTQMYPASITKILTGLVAVENCKDDEKITVTKEATKGITNDYANIALTSGEEITMEEALYTMFLASANDSANAIAIHTSGSIDNFVELMNKKCKELGTVDSHFSNANGMPDENNKTSAYDMALITQAALKNTRLMKYFGAVHYVMPTTNVKTQTVEYNTLHKMMKNTYYQYDGVIAGKTGYELMSGHTLVTVAKRNGKNLICVVMKSGAGNACYRDTTALLDYCFSAKVDSTNAEYLENPVKGAATVKMMPEDIEEQEQAEAAANKVLEQPQTNEVMFNYKGIILLTMALVCCVFSLAFSIFENRKKLCRRIQRKLYLCEKAERNIQFWDVEHL